VRDPSISIRSTVLRPARAAKSGGEGNKMSTDASAAHDLGIRDDAPWSNGASPSQRRSWGVETFKRGFKAISPSFLKRRVGWLASRPKSSGTEFDVDKLQRGLDLRDACRNPDGASDASDVSIATTTPGTDLLSSLQAGSGLGLPAQDEQESSLPRKSLSCSDLGYFLGGSSRNLFLVKVVSSEDVTAARSKMLAAFDSVESWGPSMNERYDTERYGRGFQKVMFRRVRREWSVEERAGSLLGEQPPAVVPQ